MVRSFWFQVEREFQDQTKNGKFSVVNNTNSCIPEWMYCGR